MTHQTDGRRTTAYLTKGNKTLALKVALAHDENTPAAPQQSTDRPDATSVKTQANGSTEPLAHTSTVARKLARRLRARHGHRSE